MLVLTRSVGQSIVIGNGPDKITIHVSGIQGNRIAKLAIDAPKDVPVYREELYKEGIESNAKEKV